LIRYARSQDWNREKIRLVVYQLACLWMVKKLANWSWQARALWGYYEVSIVMAQSDCVELELVYGLEKHL